MGFFNTERKNYALYGAAFGLCFPVIASIIEVLVEGLPFSITSLVDVQANSPLLWIIDTAPVFLGLFASFGGLQLDKVKSQNEQLEKSNVILANLAEEAQSANKAKTEFLTNMSHEIRSPMNAITGLTYLLQKTDLSQDQQAHLSSVQRSASSLLRIINDILDFSKVEAGKLDIESTAFSPEEVLGAIIDQVNVKLTKKADVELQVRLGSEMPTQVVGDALRFQQVVSNLLDNAVKFTYEGEVLLTVDAVEIPSGHRLDVTVTDTGIGLSENQVDKLFQPFTQADYSTTRKFGGTGLGLTICKNLIELMGGEISVESTIGKGSTFSFYINVGKEATAHNLMSGFKDFHKKVLVVDDSPTSRAILEDMLRSFGFEVVVAESGEEARDKFAESVRRQEPFELLLIDWRMPQMDGIETIERLNQLYPSEAPTIIMVTAYGREEVMQEAKRVNVDGFLVKPVNPSLMYDTLMNVFSDHVINQSREHGKAATTKEVESLVGLRILLVEDNEINQQVALELLKLVNVSADVASNGEQAIEKVDKNEYDLILMDIQMPGMDGLTATKEIRKKGHKKVPIIAMTAHAFVGEREKSMDAGMNDHLTKPVDPDALYKTIYDFCIGKGRRTSAVPQEAPSENSAIVDDLTRLSGIIPSFDLEGALRRCGGNRNLLRSILAQFSHQQHEILKDLVLTDSTDRETLRSMVHNLKGVAANVGLSTLSKRAAETERAITENLEHAASLTSELRAALVEVLGALEHFERPTDAESTSTEPASASSLKTMIDEVVSLLESGDPTAAEHLSDTISQAPPEHAAHLKEAYQHAIAWEPDEASVILRRIHERL